MLNNVIQTKLTAFSAQSIEVVSTTFAHTGLEITLAPNTLYLIDFGSLVTETGDLLDFKLQIAGTLSSYTTAYEVNGSASRLVLGTTYSITESTLYMLRMWGSIKTSGLTTLSLYAKKATDLNDPTIFAGGVYLNARQV